MHKSTACDIDKKKRVMVFEVIVNGRPLSS